MNKKWICIDFGTCNTAAAILIDGSPQVVPYGNVMYFPTVACVLGLSNIQVCQNAEPLRMTYPQFYKQEFKLQIGDDTTINSVSYTDIVAEILRFVKGCAEIENNGVVIDNVVLTIPAVYTSMDRRKDVMLNAAHQAGFKEVEFMLEAEAAARHYANISGDANTGISLIYDLGGGTFDPVLLDFTSIHNPMLLGNGSGVMCGGHFFDKAIYEYIKGVSVERNNPLLFEKRLEDYGACKRIKETLSIMQTATQLFSNGIQYSIDRAKFNDLISPLIKSTLESCDNVIATAGKTWYDIKQVLFVGGSTSIPLIQDMLQEHLLAHNANGVKIIRNYKKGDRKYDHLYATCLGGICKKIPMQSPAPKIGTLLQDGKTIQLKLGENKFGRGKDMDFTFDDPTMSRHHFDIYVSKSIDGKVNYTIETKSQTKATILNNLEALDLRYIPITRIKSTLMDGFHIRAGNTIFYFKEMK